MFFILQFPIHIFDMYPFFVSSCNNYKIILHVHNLPLITIKVNNFLSRMLTYRLNFYKIIKTNSSNQICLLNKSNKKKREQKGLGKARVGSLKSSITRGGGTIFGPKPYLSSLKVNTKEWVCVYKSFLIIKRRYIGWVFINKPLAYDDKNNYIKNFIHHLGISIVEKVIFLILTKHILYTQIYIKKLWFSNINLLNFLNSKYIIYLL